jgi:hypothetical protein
MLERPPGCESPHLCAKDRVCWAAKRRELRAHDQNDLRKRRFLSALICQDCGVEFQNFENLKRFCDECAEARRCLPLDVEIEPFDTEIEPLAA